MNTPPPSSTPLNYRPEWIRVADCRKHFGLSRSTIYELMAENRIVSRALKQRNHQRGIRLINYDSVRSYIASQKQGSDPEKALPAVGESETLPTLPLWLLRGMITPEVLEIVKARLCLTPERLALLIVRMIGTQTVATEEAKTPAE